MVSLDHDNYILKKNRIMIYPHQDKSVADTRYDLSDDTLVTHWIHSYNSFIDQVS